ncbi:hypothetical protein B0H11DRAFT_2296475 [Mycena galericulata]|nr:hypothetical protein B0H11DRAFT_2296475 [Mycena galericulata]
MFGALKMFATAMLVVSAAAAVVIQPPVAAASGEVTTIQWTSDPTFTNMLFSIELVHPDFNNDFAIANNVNASAGKIDVTMPAVPPGGDYTIKFVNITDINQEYGTSPSFAIAAAPSTTESATATAPLASGSAAASKSASVAASSASMYVSGISASASASGRGSANASAASATASSAATRDLAHGVTTTLLTATGAMLLGLVSAAWIL